MSDLSEVNREPLRLKGMPMKKKKKKSKESKNANKVDVKLDQHVKNETETKEIDLKNREDYETGDIQLTKAELACLKKQEKLQMSRILEKASKSHRRLVEEFNSKLDNMSEHYDIPKVSWTK